MKFSDFSVEKIFVYCNHVFVITIQGISADGTSASVTPQNCKKDQTPDNVPVNNAGNPEGAILTLSSASCK